MIALACATAIALLRQPIGDTLEYVVGLLYASERLCLDTKSHRYRRCIACEVSRSAVYRCSDADGCVCKQTSIPCRIYYSRDDMFTNYTLGRLGWEMKLVKTGIRYKVDNIFTFFKHNLKNIFFSLQSRKEN